jgi:hypothetical protein
MRATTPAESPYGNKLNLQQTDAVNKKNTVFECILVPVPQRTKELRNRKNAVNTVVSKGTQGMLGLHVHWRKGE